MNNIFWVSMFLLEVVFNIILMFTSTDTSKWQGEAIKYHHAYYHPNTGEFTWKKDCK